MIACEASEQAALFEWAARAQGKYPELGLLFHVPNGGSRDPREAAHLKRQGVKSGVPDLCLPVPRGPFHGLFIELKRVKGGALSGRQKEWLGLLNHHGYRAVVCRGWLEARETILEYLNSQ